MRAPGSGFGDLGEAGDPARRPHARNLAVAPGNWGSAEAVPALVVALNDEEPLIRGHAAWALGRIGTAGAMQVLRGRAEVEEDAWVREEIASSARKPVREGLPCHAC